MICVYIHYKAGALLANSFFDHSCGYPFKLETRIQMHRPSGGRGGGRGWLCLLYYLFEFIVD